MDEFVNILGPNKFSATNGTWNSLRLNDPLSVGYVTLLIEIKTFTQKEEWESFYYKSGVYRDDLLSKINQSSQNILSDESFLIKDINNISQLNRLHNNINTNHGRTKIQLNRKGEILHSYIKAQHTHISVEECQEAVRFRVICETWNGVIIREHNTIKNLCTIFKDVTFKKTDGPFDFKYAVDYEIFINNKLICGIQIKPNSYTWNAPYILKARSSNRRKNQEYFTETGSPVFDVIASPDGQVLKNDVLFKIKDLIK